VACAGWIGHTKHAAVDTIATLELGLRQALREVYVTHLPQLLDFCRRIGVRVGGRVDVRVVGVRVGVRERIGDVAK
jgi:hypothetical protein